ncbi:MAG: type II secretion system protein GspM [Tepidimonas sp.]|uniref:type II secretion system protein GspM n=1 Tax=Tepidimonas sp. TaxID=2002775 RepID=UPI00298F3527|nr:type II secretion system protein GspM [Tepidimonas sp.]MCS6809639.1 type II secretion system protein GspM [Tepidimonas sp.]MDW8336528.1 type II secretion system protein GspM [Tepidimonas sp.]
MEKVAAHRTRWLEWAQRQAWTLLGGALLLGWTVFVVVPSWRAWQTSPQRLAQAQAELQRIAQLAAALAEQRSVTQPPEPASTLRALTQEWLGPTATVEPDPAQGWRVQLHQTEAAALAGWLTAVRQQGRLHVVHLELQRDATAARWSGHVGLQAGGGRR